MSVSPTRRQMALLRYVHGHILATGMAPTIRECVRDMGFSSKSVVHWLLKGLQERGTVRILPGQERGIEVLTPPAIPMIDGTPLYAVPVALSRRV
ncbi:MULTISPECIES: hypothetical protein [unclassified Novosphingobium]|uniref:LexA family protein n=1 Tax=unclassified Novosphingobium TaxID=2644732 RepID=UPI000D326B1F|nr:MULTISPECIES: hypothetical protein [unclassified Novosphingobium]PTR11798.1 LexA DNA binding domain-containing protein [Novosphingobium sp. GV055]PUB04838.1 LexA DNA binding domain-containing protein [Novosphingobium sp. GV061]PUB21157.1 LexA DNA binding domain-containing protein [Novosphingobium sp. GV079]PUB42883.1 LexA DNA binding domain-containing protein [Novosphingobium sp. GV027]